RRERINSASLPPCDFVTEAVDVTVMGSAQRYREFIADLEPHCPRLSEAQMVGISGASAANQTRMRCHEFEVGFIAMSTRLAEHKLAFIDFAEKGIGRKSRRRLRRIIGDR